MIKWKDDYNIGISKIDEQHKKLFEITNIAYELLGNEFCIDKYDKIIQILEELKGYAIYHFKSEEEYMLSINYRKFLSQKVEHDEFIRKINDIDLNAIDENQDKYIMEILEFVISWISVHILSEDKQIASN
ncbi:MAG: hemerythrin family protein [Clostridium sp.]|uniref:bacteriohemerythrin n=1 Tax=Clostridium sp. TaxID=1506 RepID=UPI003052C58D